MKKKQEIREKPTVIYCYDGSDIAYEGLLDMVEFCQNLKARILVVHSASPDTAKYTNILQHQIRELKKMSKDIDLDFKILEAERTPSETLLKFLKENESQVDFISVMVVINGVYEEWVSWVDDKQSLRWLDSLCNPGGHLHQPHNTQMTDTPSKLIY